MAIDLDALFTQLGKLGKLLYLTHGGQSGLPAAFTALFAALDPGREAILAPLATGQAGLIRSSAAWCGTPLAAAASLIQSVVAADVPAAGGSLGSALTELRRQMRAGSKTVAACTVAATGTAQSGNVGSGVLLASTRGGDGLVQEHAVAETLRLVCTADSYTGGQPAGQERFTLTGAPNTAAVSDWNWPAGSSAAATLAANSADASLATNGNFASWSGSPLAADGWTLGTGAWGTDAQQSATGFRGAYSLQFLPGSTLTALSQPVSLAALASYGLVFWLRTLSGTASAGTLVAEFVDGSGTLIADAQGVNNSLTVALTGLTTAWAASKVSFRLPAVPPAAVNLRFRLSVALSGASVLLDDVTLAPLTAAYPGGPRVGLFSGATPWAAGDAFDLAVTNDQAGASYGANFQTLLQRVSGDWTFLLPSTGGTPSYANNLITS